MQDFFRTIFIGLSACEYGGIQTPSVDFLAGEPLLDDLENIVDLFFGQWMAFWDTMPFLKALSAARARCVLGDKNRMIPHGRLPSIVSGMGLCQSFQDEIVRMLQNGFETFLFQISFLFAEELKPTAELRPAQSRKKFIHITHRLPRAIFSVVTTERRPQPCRSRFLRRR